VALIRTDVSEECIASIIRVKGVSELGTTVALSSTVYSVDSQIHGAMLLATGRALLSRKFPDINFSWEMSKRLGYCGA
jgi:hypothetical protein